GDGATHLRFGWVRYSKYRLNIMQRCVAPTKVPPPLLIYYASFVFLSFKSDSFFRVGWDDME
ncbi:hypothetical protein JW935_10155, partial [candidate division KSB1 bacterium]|nr:hypothetical protein [candidate division KSB1 bacterium]